MRTWLAFLVATVVATAGVSVYLVRNPPASASPPAPDAVPEDEPDEGGLPDVRSLPPPTDVTEGVPAANDTAAMAEETPAPDAAEDAPPVGTMPEGEDPDEAPEEDAPAPTKKSEAPRKPTPWTRTWNHSFTDGPLVIPVDVEFGYAQLNFTVRFTPTGLTPAAAGSGEVQLTWTDAPVPKVTCRSPVPLTSPTVCGPHTTPATEGAWEVAFVGSGELDAQVTLTAWIEP